MAGRWGMANYVYPRRASGTYEVRFPIPSELQELFPKPKGNGNSTHWIHSLGTKDRAGANRASEPVTLVLRGYVDWLRGENLSDFERLLLKWFLESQDQFRAIKSYKTQGEALADQLKSEGLSRDEAFKVTLRMIGIKDARSATDKIPEFLTTSEVMSMIGDLRDAGDPEFVGHSYFFLVKLLRDNGIRPPVLSGKHDGLLLMLSRCGETLRNLLEFELAIRTGIADGFQPDVAYLRAEATPAGSSASTPRESLKAAQIVADATPALGEFFSAYEARTTSVARPVEPRTIEKRRVAWLAFSNWIGEARTLGSLAKKDIWDFHDALVDAPRNAGIRSELKGKSFRELVAIGRSHPNRYPKKSQQTIKSQLSQIRTVLELAVTRGIIHSNPAAGVTATGGEQSVGVRAFTIDELNVLFAHPVFANTPPSIRDDEFWVPLLQLFSGCRLSELAVPLSDVITNEGETPHFRIAPSDDRRLKNDGSKRLIPIHPELCRIGFLDYVQSMRDRNETKLFPKWKKPPRKNSDGSYDGSVRRRRFNKTILTEVGINQRDVSARSFRKNFEQLITEGGVPDRIALRLQGRKMGTSADHYLPKELSPQRLEEYLSKCSYMGLVLDHLSAA